MTTSEPEAPDPADPITNPGDAMLPELPITTGVLTVIFPVVLVVVVPIAAKLPPKRFVTADATVLSNVKVDPLLRVQPVTDGPASNSPMVTEISVASVRLAELVAKSPADVELGTPPAQVAVDQVVPELIVWVAPAAFACEAANPNPTAAARAIVPRAE